jgi:hypothetical protein
MSNVSNVSNFSNEINTEKKVSKSRRDELLKGKDRMAIALQEMISLTHKGVQLTDIDDHEGDQMQAHEFTAGITGEPTVGFQVSPK